MKKVLGILAGIAVIGGLIGGGIAYRKKNKSNV